MTVFLCLVSCLLIAAAIAPNADAAFGLKAKWGAGGGVGGLGLYDGGLVEPASVAIGPGGNRYVAEQRDCSVRIFTSGGTFVRRWGGTCDTVSTTATGFRSPSDIAVDMNGDVYIVDQNQSRIQVFDGFGVWQKTIGSGGAHGGELFAPASVAVTPLSATPDVYVADVANVRIQKFTYNGSFVWAAGKDVDSVAAGTGFEVCTAAPDCKAGEAGSGSGELNNPYGLDLGAAGGPLVVADALNSRVQTFNPATGQPIGGFDTPSISPLGVALDQASGDVWVDRFGQGSAWLERYDSTGNVTATVGDGTAGSGDGKFGAIGQLTATPSGGVLAPDYVQHRVQEFAADGSFVSKFGLNGGPGWQRGTGDGEFSTPHGVFADASNVWVADSGNNRVQKFSLAGVFQSKFGASGAQGKQFNWPSAVAIGSSPDRIYVADGSNQRVQEFDSSNEAFVRAIGRDVSTSTVTANASEICVTAGDCKAANSGPGDGEFNYPVDLAISPTDQDLYVVSQNSNKVERLDRATLAHVATYGGTGSGDGQMNAPQAIAFEPDGSFWVAEFNNNRVQKFDATPAHAFVKQFRMGSFDGQTAYPVGLAVVGSELHVTESGLHRVAVFDTGAASVTPAMQPALRTYGILGSNDGDFYQPYQIEAGPTAGDVYVAGSGNSRIQQLGDIPDPPVPTLAITAPADGTTVDTETIDLAYTATNGAGQALSCNPGNGPVPLPIVGDNLITVTCVNPFGGSLTDSVTVTRIPLDVTPPVVTIDAPLNGLVTASNSVQVDYTATDDSGTDPVCTPMSGSTVSLTAGVNVITVSCEDAKHNVGTASVSVTYNPPAPPPEPAKPQPPTLTLTVAKKIKFKGKIPIGVSCDTTCSFVLTATVKSGKKTYVGSGTATGIAGGVVAVRIKFKSKDTKAIKKKLKTAKSLTAKFTVTATDAYGAKTGKSGSVTMSR